MCCCMGSSSVHLLQHSPTDACVLFCRHLLCHPQSCCWAGPDSLVYGKRVRCSQACGLVFACIDSQSKVSCFCQSLVLSKMRVQDRPNAHWLNKTKISLLNYIAVAPELTGSKVHFKNQLQWKLKCTLCSTPLHQVHLLNIRDSQENKQEKCFRPLCRKTECNLPLIFSSD